MNVSNTTSSLHPVSCRVLGYGYYRHIFLSHSMIVLSPTCPFQSRIFPVVDLHVVLSPCLFCYICFVYTRFVDNSRSGLEANEVNPKVRVPPDKKLFTFHGRRSKLFFLMTMPFQTHPRFWNGTCRSSLTELVDECIRVHVSWSLGIDK